MRVFKEHWLKFGVAKEMRRLCLASGMYYDGLMTSRNMALLDTCKAQHLPTGTQIIFTRDSGMHSSGWWKNPDYERCWHLSLSFMDPFTGEPRPKDWAVTAEWLEAFYGGEQRFIWSEPPYSPQGKSNDVWHYRVFCDPAWSPISPRGEVYSKDNTAPDWLSYSDYQDAKARALQALTPLPGEQ